MAAQLWLVCAAAFVLSPRQHTTPLRATAALRRPSLVSDASMADEDDSVGVDNRMVSAPSFSSSSYLTSISRLADDGRSLLRAPQRYSSRQWVGNLVSLRSCRILSAVSGQLLWQCLWCLLVSLLYAFSRGAVPTLPALPHSLLGGVLGVLLGFRTNQSCECSPVALRGSNHGAHHASGRRPSTHSPPASASLTVAAGR